MGDERIEVRDIGVARDEDNDKPENKLAEHLNNLMSPHGAQEAVIILDESVELFELPLHFRVHNVFSIADSKGRLRYAETPPFFRHV